MPVNEELEEFLVAWVQAFLEQQEPLGPEFEAVWDAHAAELYEP